VLRKHLWKEKGGEKENGREGGKKEKNFESFFQTPKSQVGDDALLGTVIVHF
jgi:hypothetical protein